MKEIKDYIEQYAKLLPVGTSLSYVELERRAGEFLHIMSMITEWKHAFSHEKIRLLSMQTATFASELSKGTGKTVTENKTMAEASGVYIEAREALEDIENDISYLKAYYDLFQNAHIFYRNLTKQENG